MAASLDVHINAVVGEECCLNCSSKRRDQHCFHSKTPDRSLPCRCLHSPKVSEERVGHVDPLGVCFALPVPQQENTAWTSLLRGRTSLFCGLILLFAAAARRSFAFMFTHAVFQGRWCPRYVALVVGKLHASVARSCANKKAGLGSLCGVTRISHPGWTDNLFWNVRRNARTPQRQNSALWWWCLPSLSTGPNSACEALPGSPQRAGRVRHECRPRAKALLHSVHRAHALRPWPRAELRAVAQRTCWRRVRQEVPPQAPQLQPGARASMRTARRKARRRRRVRKLRFAGALSSPSSQ